VLREEAAEFADLGFSSVTLRLGCAAPAVDKEDAWHTALVGWIPEQAVKHEPPASNRHYFRRRRCASVGTSACDDCWEACDHQQGERKKLASHARLTVAAPVRRIVISIESITASTLPSLASQRTITPLIRGIALKKLPLIFAAKRSPVIAALM